MPSKLIIVANKTGAKIFTLARRTEGPVLIRSLTNPKGKLRRKEIVTDKPGRSYDNRSHARHALSTRQGVRAHVLESFGKRLARVVGKLSYTATVSELILIAEPHSLGVFRKELKRETGELPIRAVRKDLGKLLARELRDRIIEVI